MTLAYIRGPHPDQNEGGVDAKYRNASLWKGETEPADLVYAHRADIRAAYEAKGVKALPFPSGKPEPPPVKGEVVAKGGGWFDVVVDGAKINDKALREGDARALLRSI